MQFCKPSQATENKTGPVTCSPRLVLSHIDTLNKSGCSFTPFRGCSCGMTQKGVSMTKIHYSHSDNIAGFKLHLNVTVWPEVSMYN
jgi:hypothetical protein